MSKKTLGLLGGMGPAATTFFLNRLIALTPAEKDQDYLDVIVIDQASVPDRTAYILDPSQENPGPVLITNAKKLEAMGCDYLAMTCNTAHFFAEEIQEAVSIPFLDMIRLAGEEAVKRGSKKLGFMGTRGTEQSGLYRRECQRRGIAYQAPTPDQQAMMDQLIYGQVKAGQPVDYELYKRLIDSFRQTDCTQLMVGCTELSTVNGSSSYRQSPFIIDAMEVLARTCLYFAGIEAKKEV